MLFVHSSKDGNDHPCGLEVTSLLLTQRVRVRTPVGSISWLRFFPGFSLNRKINVRKFGPHSSRLSYGHHIPSKQYIICSRTATVSDHSCSTWQWLKNQQQQPQKVGITLQDVAVCTRMRLYVLKRVKNYLWSTTEQNCFNSLCVVHALS